MAGFIETLKIIIVPAFIAAFLYLLIAYAIVPVVRRHRDRYNQYVPVDAIRDTTSAVGSRMVASTFDFFFRLFERRRRPVESADEQDGDEYAFGEEEGETMVGFDFSRRERSIRGGNVEVHSDARLSRDLEEGFKDDSEEDMIDDRSNGGNT